MVEALSWCNATVVTALVMSGWMVMPGKKIHSSRWQDAQV